MIPEEFEINKERVTVCFITHTKSDEPVFRYMNLKIKLIFVQQC